MSAPRSVGRTAMPMKSASAMTPAATAEVPTTMPGKRVDREAGDQHREVRSQPDRGADPHEAGPAEADEHALLEAAVRDGRRPRRHDEEPHAGGTADGFRRADHTAHDEAVKRGRRDQDVENGERARGDEHEPAEFLVGCAVLAQRGGGGQQHDDRSFHDQRDRKDHAAVRGEVEFRIGKARHEGAHRRKFEAHHEPARGERPPDGEDAAEVGSGAAFHEGTDHSSGAPPGAGVQSARVENMSNGIWTRRRFLNAATRGGALATAASILGAGGVDELLDGAFGASRGPLEDLIDAAPRARYWVAAADGACSACHVPAEIAGRPSHVHAGSPVLCTLCARNCRLADGERGMCRARMNVRGELRTLVYGRPISVHVDPIEKKPFFHFLPGSQAYSLATSGCPLRCRFCQNWEISQARPEDYRAAATSPEAMADAAVAAGAPVIAFTYNEPTVFIEYLTDIARAARLRGCRCVLVSCGYMNEAPLAEMCAVLDAIKIDLKGFSEDFYRKASDAELAPVLRSIRQIGRSDVHLELVNLVVPTLNDSETMLSELATWVAGEIGPDVPVHFTRFHPDYQLLNLSPTPVKTLERAREIAMRAGLHYAYVGNVPGHPGNNTYCPQCGAAVIERDGLFVTRFGLVGGACPACKHAIAGVWS